MKGKWPPFAGCQVRIPSRKDTTRPINAKVRLFQLSETLLTLYPSLLGSLDAVCFSQPHGHKRTAMFTAFAMSLWALRTRDAIFTTDSDTLVQDNGLDEMLTLLRSQPGIGGVTADVKIWNRAEGLLTRLCAARYWFAFNIERACQSMWRCVGCLSGPMSMYRSSDLETILGPW